MLAEFALLPSVFDEKVHPDVTAWKEQLRDLGNGMFPRTQAATCPGDCCRLTGRPMVETCRATGQQCFGSERPHPGQGLLKRIANVTVRRPGHLKQLGEHNDWACETIDSHRSNPFDRIVACPATVDRLRKDATNVWNLSDVDKDEFWDQISADWSPELCIRQQVDSLGKICLHSDFLSLISPHIQGADDETDFAIALIRRAFDRPSGYPPPEIEIHSEGPHKPEGHPDFADAMQKKVKNIRDRLSEALQPGQQLHLILWPKLLDRYLIAGLRRPDASGTERRIPRWGVHLGHIARKADSHRPPGDTEWHLVDNGRLGQLFKRYAAEHVTGYLPPSPIRIEK
jgi:hypothetical protein